MTKGSPQRRAKMEWSRHVAEAQRSIKAGAHAEAIRSLIEASKINSSAGLLNDIGVSYLQIGRLSDSIQWLSRAVAMDPNLGRAHHNLAIALLDSGDDETAFNEFRRAVALAPELALAHGRLADLYWQRGMRREAAAEYVAAAGAAKGTQYGEFCGAMALAFEDRHEEAEAELRRLTDKYPSDAWARHQLGLVLLARGRFDEACACFEAAIATDPRLSAAYQALAGSKKFTEADRPLIDKMTALLEDKDWATRFSPGVGERHLMTLHFALGKALDDVGDYAGAMRHFDAANEVRHKIGPFQRAVVEGQIERLIARYTPEFFADNAALGSDDPTPILVFGMPRSGTTLVERVLSGHPDVHPGGELDFWRDRGLVWTNADPSKLATSARELREGYLRALRGTDEKALRATDKMPFNFFWLGHVHLLFPNARLLSCRRNPIDTCLSNYMTPTLAKIGFSSRREDLVTYYRLYARIMDHWRAVIPADRLMDVDYEELVAAPEPVARRIVEFCGLSWNDACLHPEKNETAVTTASHWQARQPIYKSSVARWRRYEPWIGALRELEG